MKQNHLLALALCAALTLSLAACGQTAPPAEPDRDAAEAISKFTDCDTQAEAEVLAGFSISVPAAVDGMDAPCFRADQTDAMLEVFYRNDQETLRIRKAAGDGDVSGNHGAFAQENTVDVDGLAVTMKGEDEQVKLAVWTKDGCAYSIDSSAPMDQDAMCDLVRTVGADGEGAADGLIGGDPAVWSPGGTELPNPWTAADSLEDAAALAGFSLALPDRGDDEETISVLTGGEHALIEVRRKSGERQVCIRKGQGDGDISGDYNVYAETETVSVGAGTAELRGDGDTVSLATWTEGAYAYSIGVCGGDGLDRAEMEAMIAAVR